MNTFYGLFTVEFGVGVLGGITESLIDGKPVKWDRLIVDGIIDQALSHIPVYPRNKGNSKVYCT